MCTLPHTVLPGLVEPRAQPACTSGRSRVESPCYSKVSYPRLVGRHDLPVGVEQLLWLARAEEVAHVPLDAAELGPVVGQCDDDADAGLSPGGALCQSAKRGVETAKDGALAPAPAFCQ